MEDSKLLELAGLAAGEIYTQEHNPLNRDDLALRLSVRLNMRVETNKDNASAIILGPTMWPYAVEPVGKDPCASTRRAIVRAAAEIGMDK